MLNLATHDLDVMRHLTSKEVTRVSAETPRESDWPFILAENDVADGHPGQESALVRGQSKAGWDNDRLLKNPVRIYALTQKGGECGLDIRMKLCYNVNNWRTAYSSTPRSFMVAQVDNQGSNCALAGAASCERK